MNRFTVKSGPFRMSMFAQDAFEAAAEAVRFWKCTPRTCVNGEGPDAWNEEIRVTGEGHHATIERFATLNILAHLHCESPEAAWERLLRDGFSNN